MSVLAGGDLGRQTQREEREAERIAALAARLCVYTPCSAPIGPRKPQARWCSVKCRTYWVRAERRVAAQRTRPRCMICGKPMPYRTKWQGHGVNLTATTCSSACHVKRNNWFVRGTVAA